MTRDEYLQCPKLYCKRGADLPQTKLSSAAVRDIRACAEKAKRLRQRITERYSRAALARKWNVHEGTIDKILSYQTRIDVL